jgi:outer membrane lipopolysaccharide assembly protein LptE/RlpB
MTQHIKKIWLFIFCLLFSGCGYQLVGTGNTLPAHIKSISIPTFENSSSQPEIHRELTSIILRSFINDGRLKVTKKDDADLLMTGALTYYDTRTVAFSSEDLASDIIIELGVDVEVTDQIKNKIFLKQKLKTQWDYKSTSDISDTETARLRALEDAYNELGTRLVSLIIDQF